MILAIVATVVTNLVTVPKQPYGRVWIDYPQTVVLANADQKVVVMSEAYFKSMTNYFSLVEKYLVHEHEIAMRKPEVRRDWHGRVVRTSINTNDMTKTEFYADGYRYVIKMEKRVSAPLSSRMPRNAVQPRRPKIPSGIPARLKEVMRKRHESNVPKTVTIRKNGNTGAVEEVR